MSKRTIPEVDLGPLRSPPRPHRDDRLPARTAALRRQGGKAANPILPASTVSGTALTLVVAMMTFLACLTLGGVLLVYNTATTWQNQISREATIQIRPTEGADMAAALEKAKALAEGFDGVVSATILGDDALKRLLEPWLGTGLEIDVLPVPRLVTLTIDIDNPPDFAAIRSAVERDIANASLDDHRTWVDRLIAMARATVIIGLSVFGLVLSTTILTVVFATRGALAGVDGIIEVLHFVGAENRYIAARFRRRFLAIGLKGAAAGGLAAVAVFLGAGWWGRFAQLSPEAEQTAALFGRFAFGLGGHFAILAVALGIGALTALTSHLTVLRQLDTLLDRQTG